MDNVNLENAGHVKAEHIMEAVAVKTEPVEDTTDADGPQVLQPSDLVFTKHMCIKVEAEFVEDAESTGKGLGASETAPRASETARQPCWPVLTVLPMTGLTTTSPSTVHTKTEPQEEDDESAGVGEGASETAPCASEAASCASEAAPCTVAEKRMSELKDNFEKKEVGILTDASGRVRRYSCKLCGKRFISGSKLEVHMRSHTGEKPFLCDQCDRRFTQKCELKKHYRTHTGEKPYECDICHRKFTHLNTLKVHKRTHSDDKPFLCCVCNRRFAELEALEEHVLTHLVTKFACEICDRGFSEMRNLKRHMLTHTGEKPHKCELCNKTFKDPQTVKVHLRSHKGEKPYSCNVCNKTFTKASGVRLHQIKCFK